MTFHGGLAAFLKSLQTDSTERAEDVFSRQYPDRSHPIDSPPYFRDEKDVDYLGRVDLHYASRAPYVAAQGVRLLHRVRAAVRGAGGGRGRPAEELEAQAGDGV